MGINECTLFETRSATLIKAASSFTSGLGKLEERPPHTIVELLPVCTTHSRTEEPQHLPERAGSVSFDQLTVFYHPKVMFLGPG